MIENSPNIIEATQGKQLMKIKRGFLSIIQI